jgi:3-methyladenine DNA glycosylase AlkC
MSGANTTSGVRKGYNSRRAIPPNVLRALNAGVDEPRTLAEWLAVDVARLLKTALPQVGLQSGLKDVLRAAREGAKKGTMERHRSVGAALFRVASDAGDAPRFFEKLAAHPSSVVREWAALMTWADSDLSIEERIEKAKRFAADRSMNVREIAWMSYRPYLSGELDAALRLLRRWVRDADSNVRRCAVESTRPRGVWCAHLPELKENPAKGLPLLEPVRADASRYVQLSVANWLNDASKSDAAWVRGVCRRWLKESACVQTEWIVHHATRTLRRAAGTRGA